MGQIKDYNRPKQRGYETVDAKGLKEFCLEKRNNFERNYLLKQPLACYFRFNVLNITTLFCNTFLKHKMD